MTLPNNTPLQGGKYRIVRFISSGGFGCTYEAEHVLLGKRVAIKEFFVKDFCNRDETTSHVTVGTQTKVALVSKLKRKFIEEASALSRFNHPNIVHVSDVFEENGTAYYVMDFIEGKSIHEILKAQSTVPEAKAVKYITQVAEALKQVHAQNRLHLDIKPGNIIIDSNDNAILIDFGASKQYDEEAGENTSTLVGRTPGYAPLEQLGNDVVKFMPATDIYALGATLYKMLSGKTPLSATLLASGEELEPLPSSITEGTKAAIAKSMAINKRMRPQTIEEFVDLFSNGKKLEAQAEVAQKTSSPAIEEDEETDIADDSSRSAHGDMGTQNSSYPNGSYSSKAQAREIPDPHGFKDYSVSDTSYEEDEKKPKHRVMIALLWAIPIMIIFGVLIFSDSDSESPSPAAVTSVTNEIYNTTYKGTITYTGEWKNGAPNGVGTGIYKQGTYKGPYVNGIREGYGEFVTSDGSNTFKGTFKNDHYYNGYLYYDENSFFFGTFRNDAPYNGTYYEKDKVVGKYEDGKFK